MTRSAVERFDLSADIDQARSHVRTVLAHVDLVVLVVTAEAADHFEGRTPPTARSFGQHVTVDLTPAEQGTQVSVRAWSLLRTTVYDFGAARHTARAIAGAPQASTPGTIEAKPERRPYVVDPRWRWAGLLTCAAAAVLAVLGGGDSRRSELLLAALVAAALWVGAVACGAIRIRRQGQLIELSEQVARMGISFFIAF